MTRSSAVVAASFALLVASQAMALKIEAIGTGSYQQMDVEVTNDSGQDLAVTLEGNEVFVPEDPSCQDMLIAVTVELRLRPWATETARGCLSYCLSRGKATPARGARFRFLNENDNLGWLCRYGRERGMGHGEIQKLVWDYTDAYGSRDPQGPHPSTVLELPGGDVPSPGLPAPSSASAAGALLIFGRAYVPMRAVFEWLGATVGYSEGIIAAVSGARSVRLAVGSHQAHIDGRPVQMDTFPVVIAGICFVPLRFVATSMGASVSYDVATATATISQDGRSITYSVGSTVDVPVPGYQPGPPNNSGACPPHSYAQENRFGGRGQGPFSIWRCRRCGGSVRMDGWDTPPSPWSQPERY